MREDFDLYVAICDDEKFYRERIRALLEKYCSEFGISLIVDFYKDGNSLLSVDHSRYHILFLDITMPGLNGIEVSKYVRLHNKETVIVFVTSFIEYAPRGYEVNAFRYLLKDQLENAFTSCMSDMLGQFRAMQHRLALRFVEGEASIKIQDIEYIESEKRKLYFTMIDSERRHYTMYKKLDEIELLLDSPCFLRIHKSYLVNMYYVKLITRYSAEMSNGLTLPITKSRFPEVSRKYVLFKG